MKDKKKLLKQILISLAKGEDQKADKLISVFMEYIPEITPEEVTEVAQELEENQLFENAEQHHQIEEKIFQIMKAKIPANDFSGFPPGHPVHTYLQENKQIREICNRAQKLIGTEGSFSELYSDWVLVAKQFSYLDTHYLRKENQLFPYLEKRGFSHPSSVMWSVHDEIRNLARNFGKAVAGKDEKASAEFLTSLIKEAEEMTVKEERILLPKAVSLLNHKDWLEIRQGEDEIGWMIPAPPKVWDVKISMDQHLRSDPKRITAILTIIDQFFKGVPVEKLQKQFEEELQGKITPAEFALAEQKMTDLGVNDSQFESRIDELIGVFKKSLQKVGLDALSEGHPLDTSMKENNAIRALLNELREKTENIDLTNVDHSYWTEASEKLWQIDTHYVRKENQLFPSLESKGFDKPSTVMWALHDDIRQLIKYYRGLLNDKNYKELFETHELMFSAIEDMIFKEEKILWPTSLELISEQEWGKIRKGEDEIGYCLIDEPVMWTPSGQSTSEPDKTGTAKQKEEPKPFIGTSEGRNLIGGITLEVGTVTPEQINLIFKHLPFDVTFVDEFDEVRYYNKGDERVFPRSPGIIGRQVKYCHPPKSVHVVEKIVNTFKSGEKNEANFWFNFKGSFIYIQYFAVRDTAGNYKGVLEVSYDASTVKSLEGEQRLLDWE